MTSVRTSVQTSLIARTEAPQFSRTSWGRAPHATATRRGRPRRLKTRHDRTTPWRLVAAPQHARPDDCPIAADLFAARKHTCTQRTATEESCRGDNLGGQPGTPRARQRPPLDSRFLPCTPDGRVRGVRLRRGSTRRGQSCQQSRCLKVIQDGERRLDEPSAPGPYRGVQNRGHSPVARRQRQCRSSPMPRALTTKGPPVR